MQIIKKHDVSENGAFWVKNADITSLDYSKRYHPRSFVPGEATIVMMTDFSHEDEDTAQARCRPPIVGAYVVSLGLVAELLITNDSDHYASATIAHATKNGRIPFSTVDYDPVEIVAVPMPGEESYMNSGELLAELGG